jgi:hypothetical protein
MWMFKGVRVRRCEGEEEEEEEEEGSVRLTGERV